MALRPTGSQFEKFVSGQSYRAVVTGLEPVPGKFKPQFKVTFEADVDGDLVEVSDWLNQTVNARLDGQPSALLEFLNACSGRPAGKVTYFDYEQGPFQFSYRDDEKPEYSLLGSEVVIRGEHQQKKNGDGTFFTIVAYSAVPVSKPKAAKPKAPPASDEPPPADADGLAEDEIPFET